MVLRVVSKCATYINIQIVARYNNKLLYQYRPLISIACYRSSVIERKSHALCDAVYNTKEKPLQLIETVKNVKFQMSELDKDCIFCKIIRDEGPSEKIFEDEEILCIKDINPASTHHYLILPKKHIRNAKELKQEHKDLFDKMMATVNTISQQQDLIPTSTRTGFHWPPFNTVSHLHLHVICPIENMSFIKKLMFKPDSYWFVSAEYARTHMLSHM